MVAGRVRHGAVREEGATDSRERMTAGSYSKKQSLSDRTNGTLRSLRIELVGTESQTMVGARRGTLFAMKEQDDVHGVCWPSKPLEHRTTQKTTGQP